MKLRFLISSENSSVFNQNHFLFVNGAATTAWMNTANLHFWRCTATFFRTTYQGLISNYPQITSRLFMHLYRLLLLLLHTDFPHNLIESDNFCTMFFLSSHGNSTRGAHMSFYTIPQCISFWSWLMLLFMKMCKQKDYYGFELKEDL